MKLTDYYKKVSENYNSGTFYFIEDIMKSQNEQGEVFMNNEKFGLKKDTYCLCISSLCFWGFAAETILFSWLNESVDCALSTVIEIVSTCMFGILLFVSPIFVFAVPVAVLLSLFVHAFKENDRSEFFKPFPLIITAAGIIVSFDLYRFFENSF